MDNMNAAPEGLDEFLGSDTHPEALSVDAKLNSPEPEGLSEFISPELQQEQYGTPSQQALAGLEGAAKGVLGPLATGAELGLGMTTPEAIRGREEANPWTHGIAEAGAMIGSTALGVGEVAMLGKAAEAVGLGAKAGSKFINQVGADALKAAFETSLFQGGEEIHKAFVQDPNQTVESSIADIGLAGVMGGVFGGALGAGLRAMRPGAEVVEETVPKFVSEMDAPALEAGDLRASVKHSDLIKESEKQSILDGLEFGKQRSDAKEIIAAANRLGAPVLEGMTSDNYFVKKAENLLTTGAPTYSGAKRHALYQRGYDMASGAVDSALGEGSALSKAQLGDSLKSSITSRIEQESAPIKALYDEVKLDTQSIPLSDNAGAELAESLRGIKELQLSPSSPEGQIVRRVINEVPNLQTVDDIKTYKTILNRSLSPTAPSGEKRMASIISDQLKELEESSIEKFARSSASTPEAKSRIMSLIEQRKAADAQYKPFIKDIQTLAEQLGKGRIHGAQDAIDFINNRLTPEEIANKVFSKKDSEFLKFFGKKFPEQMQLVKDYQKGILREAASKSGELSPKLLFNQVNKLEPEVQNALFSKAELSTLKDAETYLRSFPKDYNPSGTAGAEAFRDMFKHGVSGALAANVRDTAMEAFIKAAGHAPETKAASELAKATVKGWNVATKGVKSIFNPSKVELPASISINIAARDKLRKLVEDYTVNPHKMLDIGASNPIPQYATSYAATSARAVNYLNSQKPNVDKKSPLDSPAVPTPDAIARYNRALDLAQNPALILKSIKDGNVRPSDLMTIKTIYPAYYKQLNEKLTTEMIESVNKGIAIPYKTRIALSMFMAQPLDSSLQPISIQTAQSVFLPKAPPPTQSGSNPSGGKRGTASLNKMANQYKTQGQRAQEDKSGER